MLVNQILALKAHSSPARARAVATVSPDATLGEAAHLLSEEGIGSLVVSSDGARPEGILSERDIVREVGRRGRAALDQPVRAAMSAPAATCQTGDDAIAILERMTHGRFRHLPVVDQEGRMIGLVSIGDTVSARLQELAAEKEALTGMIMGA